MVEAWLRTDEVAVNKEASGFTFRPPAPPSVERFYTWYLRGSFSDGVMYSCCRSGKVSEACDPVCGILLRAVVFAVLPNCISDLQSWSLTFKFCVGVVTTVNLGDAEF